MARISIWQRSFVLFGALLLALPARAGDIAPGVSVSASVRTWRSFDGELPNDTQAARWSAGDRFLIEIRRLPSFPGKSVLANGTSALEQTDGKTGQKSTYALTAAMFGGDEAARTPEGTFWEVTVRLRNNGKTPQTVPVQKNGRLDAALTMPDGKSLKPVGFVFPDVDVWSRSLLTEVYGQLAVKLAPGASTWLVLVFDVPEDDRTATLRLGKAGGLKLALP